MVNSRRDAVPASHINGREFTVNNVSGNSITINTTGLSFPDDSFTLTETDIYVMSDESESVEAFFEGASDVFEGAAVNFSSEKIVIREIGDANKHAYTNTQMAMTGTHTYTGALTSTTQTGVASTSTTSATGSGATFDISTDASGVMTVTLNSAGSGYVVGDTITIDGASLTGGATITDDVVFTVTSVDGIISVDSGQFTISQTIGATSLDSLDVLGLRTAASVNDLTTTTDWVDEKAPALKVNYNENTQQLEFRVDRTVLGTGTESNFNSFSVFGAATAEASNNLGIPTQDDASTVLIRGGEVLTTEAFVADGEEIQLNDKRFGITVKYNSDTQSFTFASGTTGELIEANGALGVPNQQKASSIEVGRFSLSEEDGSVIDTTDHFSGDNHLMSVGVSKSDAIATAGRGLASSAAVSIGDAANEDLTSVFRMTNTNGENVFNVSVNGISGVIEIRLALLDLLLPRR